MCIVGAVHAASPTMEHELFAVASIEVLTGATGRCCFAALIFRFLHSNVLQPCMRPSRGGS